MMLKFIVGIYPAKQESVTYTPEIDNIYCRRYNAGTFCPFDNWIVSDQQNLSLTLSLTSPPISSPSALEYYHEDETGTVNPAIIITLIFTKSPL